MRTDLELFLADGTRLADMSDEALNDIEGSLGKYMKIIGRTPHYRRKNKTNLELYDQDMRRIASEKERRKALNTVQLGGWHGYIKQVHPKCILALWEAKDYKGEYADDVVQLLKIDGKLHLCPNDREPSHYAIYDELYELRMDRFTEYAPWRSGVSHNEIVRLPGRIYKRLLHNAGLEKALDDPLKDAPWTVLEAEPDSLK